MKKLLAIILVFVLTFSLIGCAKKNDNNFKVPENYQTVVFVSINPQFKLYLDKENVVIAIEPLNADAKSLGVTETGVGFIEVLQNIVKVSNENGFIKENATVEVVVSETVLPENTEALLKTAESAVQQIAEELKITVTPVTQYTNTLPPVTQNSSQSEGDGESQESQSDSSHTHKFSDATCTKPATCSCGETTGKALGHAYQNGVCIRCKEKEPTTTFTLLHNKVGTWRFKYVSGGLYHSASMQIHTGPEKWSISVSIGVPLSSLPEEVQENVKPDCVVFGGEYYYVAKGDSGKITSVSESGTKQVIVRDLNGKQLTLLRTNENTMSVVSCDASFMGLGHVPSGTVMTFS